MKGSRFDSCHEDSRMSLSEQAQIRKLPLFRGLEEGCLERLLAAAWVRRLPKHRLLFSEGTRPEWLHLLISGRAEAFTRVGDKDCTLLILSPSDAFMPAAALVDEDYLVSGRTLKTSRLLFLKAEVVREEMAACPELACRLVKLLAGQLRVAMRHIKDVKTRTAPQRLAAYLLRLVDENGLGEGAELTIAKGTLASRLSMTAETLSRSLQVISEHGIMLRGHRIVLRDRAAVERFCRPDPLIDGSEVALYVRAW